MKKHNLVAISLMVGIGFSSNAVAKEVISIVGSSTVFPFSSKVAEVFGKKTKFKTPKIESTGSGGGMKLFCAGDGMDTPDITNASRRIKKKEFEKCHKNGVKKITEVKIGFDGIAIANSKKAKKFSLTTRDLFLALAAKVPNKDGKLVKNPFKTWNDVNSKLPKSKIEVLGPPPTSGTRDAFAELAMEKGCKSFEKIKAMKKKDKKAYKAICHTVREDGYYIEAGENDNMIIQKLKANPNALGVFGFSFLDQNADSVQGSDVNGNAISFENISSGAYPVSRPLYFYIKGSHVGKVPGIKEFVAEFVKEATIGDDGYLLDKGLIPLSKKERKAVQDAAINLKNLSL
jgi:phosphate transport system substrate-binding protein